MRVNGECSNGETTHLWLNSKHEKSDNKRQISLGNASAESVVAEVATLTKDNKFSTKKQGTLKIKEHKHIRNIKI